MIKYILALLMPFSLKALEVDKYIMPDIINDIEINQNEKQIYVSFGNLDYISIKYQNMMEKGRVVVGNSPYKMSFDPSFAHLYTTLKSQGVVTSLDLSSNALMTLDISVELNNNLAYEVIYGLNDEIFVSGDPYSGGFSYVVKVDLQNNIATRIASNRIIRAAPYFEIDRSLGFLYIGEGFNPNSLYKIDLMEPNYPIIVEDAHGTVSGMRSFALSPDGTKIITRSSQVIRASSLIVDGNLTSFGIPAYSLDGSELGVFNYDSNTLDILDSNTLILNQTIDISMCAMPNNSGFSAGIKSYTDGWLLWSSDVVCLVHNPAELMFISGFE
jgi:DNA-binding beta-propeller fold protein YncE